MSDLDGTTAYGFDWGQVAVTRLAEIDGRKVVMVSTDHHRVEVYASPTGRSVRVFIDGKEARA